MKMGLPWLLLRFLAKKSPIFLRTELPFFPTARKFFNLEDELLEIHPAAWADGVRVESCAGGW